MLTKADYAAVYRRLQPRGLAWPMSSGSVWGRLYAAFSRLTVQVHATLVLLTRELDPRSASQLLNEWEVFVGLPDECTVAQSTESERRLAVHTRITATGGASAAYFIGIAEFLGYTGTTITEFPVSRFGRARFQARFYGRTWRHAWQMNVAASEPVPARFMDRFGVRFKQSAASILECRVGKLKPSHTKLLFHYGA